MNDAQELANLLDDAISMLKSGVVDDIENIATVADLKRSLTKSYTDRQEELKNIIQSMFNSNFIFVKSKLPNPIRIAFLLIFFPFFLQLRSRPGGALIGCGGKLDTSR
jgi:hypothetical protein